MTVVWFVVVTVGPLLLLAVLIWGWLRNRAGSRATETRSERGAKELREELREDPEYR